MRNETRREIDYAKVALADLVAATTKEIDSLEEEISDLKRENNQLRDRIADLEAEQ